MNAFRSLALALSCVACDSSEPPTLPPAPTETASASATASVATAIPSASTAPTEIELVRRGDLGAMKRLERRPLADRTMDELLALTDGRAELARIDALRIVSDLATNAELRRDPSTLAYAAKLSLDPAAAPSLISGFVAIGDAGLLDFVHDLGVRGDPAARLPLLVHDALRIRAHRAKASKALSVLLDLEDAELCWQIANQLPRAAADADARASALLDRFALEKGCGPKKLDDCFPCLREPANADALQKAKEAATARKFDAFWLAK
ncbi:MAG: hypothetical protein JNK04_00625 [Myxococcales bacterium]|nr:hypothetical protein [Myxococcales bacterium]